MVWSFLLFEGLEQEREWENSQEVMKGEKNETDGKISQLLLIAIIVSLRKMQRHYPWRKKWQPWGFKKGQNENGAFEVGATSQESRFKWESILKNLNR